MGTHLDVKPSLLIILVHYWLVYARF